MKMDLAELTEGQRFKILVENSKVQKQAIAERLKIIPGSLSRIFRREKLSDEMRKAASELFGVPESYFTGEPIPDQVREPDAPYLNAKEEVARLKAENAVLREELEEMRAKLARARMGNEGTVEQ